MLFDQHRGPEPVIFRFAQFELDTGNYCLKHEGIAVSIEPQVFDLLAYLIANRDRLVTRQELLDCLWAGKVVSDATLSNHIKMARAAVKDDGESQQIIKTIRGRGYQFVAEAREETGDSQSSSLKLQSMASNKTQKFTDNLSYNKRWIAVFLSVLVLLIAGFFYFNKATLPKYVQAHRSIAILPFENRSNLKKDEYFTEGIHHDLLMQVAKIRDIKTISRTSVNLYRDTQKSIPIIASELGVAVVLEGGVQRAGHEIRINVQLVDGVTDELLWAESYTRALSAENVFAIQTEIAGSIAAALSTVLSAEEVNALAARPTQNLKALDEYFMAVAELRKNNSEAYQQAIEHLRAALELDAEFALAYAVLAQIYLDQIYWAGSAVKQQLALASPLIERALHLDPQLSEGHAALASIQEYQGLHDLAYQSYKKALELKPSNEKVYAALGRFQLWIKRDVEASVKYFSKALSLNPKDILLKENLCEAYIRNGQFFEARALVSDILQQAPNFAPAYRALADIEAWENKNIPEAQKLLRRAIDLDPAVPTYALKLALRFVDIGENALALHWLRYSLKVSPDHRSAKFVQGMILLLEGNLEEAFDVFRLVPQQSAFVNQALYHQLHIGILLQRPEDVKIAFQKVFPELFAINPTVNAHNYVNAYLLAHLYININQSEKAKPLLERSILFALKEPIGDWQGRHRNWISQIYGAMDEREKAIKAYQAWVGEGHYRDEIYNITYQLIKSDPQFNQAETKMLESLGKAKKTMQNIVKQNPNYWLP